MTHFIGFLALTPLLTLTLLVGFIHDFQKVEKEVKFEGKQR
jgi:hypothetical protein